MTEKKEPLKMNVDLREYSIRGTIKWYDEKIAYYEKRERSLFEIKNMLNKKLLDAYDEVGKYKECLIFVRQCAKENLSCCSWSKQAKELLWALDMEEDDDNSNEDEKA